MAANRDSPPGHPEIIRIVAPNPGPMTLAGTNTYLVAPPGIGATYVIDPGPADRRHVEAIAAAAQPHGPIAGVILTHSHADHAAAAPQLGAELLWGTVGAGDEYSGAAGAGAEPGATAAAAPPPRVGPFDLIATPGHAVDHVAVAWGRVCFCGDLVLGEGSSFVPPDGGSLAAYMESLARLREREWELLCPGHGPYITDPEAKLGEYIEHRLERERRLVDALAAGERSRRRLLDAVWDDVPAELRGAAAVVMEAHLEKLAAERRLDPAELRQ